MQKPNLKIHTYFLKCLQWEITCMPSCWQQSDSKRLFQLQGVNEVDSSNIVLSQSGSHALYSWGISNIYYSLSRPQDLFLQPPNRSLGQKQWISKPTKTIVLPCKHFWINLNKYIHYPKSNDSFLNNGLIVHILTSIRIQFPNQSHK